MVITLNRKGCQNCALNTIHYGGNIHHFFYIFGYLLFFPKYMKNKIGILENDIYIFPIVNSVICEVHSFVMFCTNNNITK